MCRYVISLTLSALSPPLASGDGTAASPHVGFVHRPAVLAFPASIISSDDYIRKNSLVLITSDDQHHNKQGTVVDFKGGGWYVVRVHDAHRDVFAKYRPGNFTILREPADEGSTSLPKKKGTKRPSESAPKIDRSLAKSWVLGAYNAKSTVPPEVVSVFSHCYLDEVGASYFRRIWPETETCERDRTWPSSFWEYRSLEYNTPPHSSFRRLPAPPYRPIKAGTLVRIADGDDQGHDKTGVVLSDKGNGWACIQMDEDKSWMLFPKAALTITGTGPIPIATALAEAAGQCYKDPKRAKTSSSPGGTGEPVEGQAR